VFFGGPSGIYHVGIYAGHHRIWHAPRTGTVVALQRIWTSDYLVGEVR
jgi:cell wall-associated NlpC family hydrolase